ncbi:autotransporter domain-containing protein [Zavarzinia compransoris]|uniref:Autotransporter domain-containing protein n=1 Tax=Zavarzinia compransoris TaxID=1264899 RepID=A0A317DYS9_9PROT|nr:autotransporter domain-containing protein [Zavarzinia compransoris]PWR19016.1 hypothetical protein DKG75_18800 [Zavarzinia compransoris]TDP49020.1 autotransporter-like protein [Zavarzinia compransoris]
MGGGRVGLMVAGSMIMGAAGGAAALATAQRYADQFVFSASDADTGNTMRSVDETTYGILHGTNLSIDSSAYYKGRFSNGPTYAELLPAYFGFGYDDTHNYAWGGAATGPYGAPIPRPSLLDFETFLADATNPEVILTLLNGLSASLPRLIEDPLNLDPTNLERILAPSFISMFTGHHSMRAQVDEYLAENPATRPDALYIAGPAYNNYYAYGDTDPVRPVDDQMGMIDDLHGAGARDFMLLAYGGSDEDGGDDAYAAAQRAETIARTNQWKREHPGSNLYVVDLGSFIEEVEKDPAKYGFSDDFRGCVQTGQALDACPDDRLRYDFVHPTASAHRMLAEVAYATITSAYEGTRQGAALPGLAGTLAGRRAANLAAALEAAPAAGLLALGEGMAGAAAGETSLGHRLARWFARAALGFGTRDEGDGRQGYSYVAGGIVGGIEALLDHGFGLGLALSYDYLDTDYDGVGGGLGLHAFGATVFGTWQAGPLALRAEAAYHRDLYRGIRRNTGFSIEPEARGETAGETMSAGLESRYALALGDGITLTPALSLRYTRVAVDGYEERGAGVLNLRMEAQDEDSLIAALVVEINRPTAWETYRVTPSLRLGLVRELLDRDRLFVSSFSSGQITVAPVGTGARTAALVGLGLDFAADGLRPGARLAFAYDGRLASDGQDHTVSASLRVPFGP